VLARRLLTGAVSRVSNTALGILIAFLMTPFIIRHLGDDAYGLWLLVAAITGFYGVLDFGLSVATQRAIAQALASGDVESANITVVTAFATFCIISLLMLLITVAIAAAGPLIVSSGRVGDFRVVVCLLATSIVFLFPTYAVSGIYSANFRYDLVSRIHLIRVLSRFALIYIAVTLGGRLIAMAVITTITDVGAGVAMLVVVRRLAPWLRWSGNFFRPQRLKELSHFGGMFLFVTLCERGRGALPAFAMNATSGLSGVTLFGIAQQIYDYFVQFLTNIFGVFQPLFVRQQSAQDHAANERDFIFVTQLALAVAMVLAVGVVACAPDFVQAWLGSRFKRSLGPLFILVLLGVFHTSLQASMQLLLAYSKQKALAVLSAIEVVVSAILVLPLAKWLQLDGVAVAILLPALLSRVVVQPFIVRQVMNINLYRYFGALGRSAIGLAGVSWVMVRARDIVPGSGYWKVLLMGTIAVAVAAPVAYVLCLDRAVRRRVVSVVTGVLTHGGAP
jgi:O-antigen/teichoic acid export membrane protein